jgi:hypothetical protein
MAEKIDAFRRALEMNDEAQRRTITQEAVRGNLDAERLESIAEEAKIWLRLLFSIHWRP